MYDRPLLGLKESQEALQVMIKEVESKPDYYWQHAVIAIVDYSGSLIAFARMDGAHQQGAFMAIRKAYTAAIWGQTTTDFRKIVKEPMDVLSFGTDVTLSKGGVPIIPPYITRSEYNIPYVVGAIGVGNVGRGEKDEEVAMAGAKYLESVLWPSQ
jgi:uncharacterized protein GlcG (DUF336 family)